MKEMLHTALARPLATKGHANNQALDQKQLAAFVGVIALAMPFILYLGSWLGPFCQQSSISHYYYMPFIGSIFVASMGFIGIFMFCYRGHSRADRIMARIGAAMALLVAIFPTAGDGCPKSAFLGRAFVDSRDTPATVGHEVVLFTLGGFDLTSQHVHFGSAAILFVILGWFALWSFRRDNGEGVRHRAGGRVETTIEKTRRNRIYTVCGLTIFGCLAILALLGDSSDGIDALLPPFFLFEAIALFAFGVSWAVKGRLPPQVREHPVAAAMRAS